MAHGQVVCSISWVVEQDLSESIVGQGTLPCLRARLVVRCSSLSLPYHALAHKQALLSLPQVTSKVVAYEQTPRVTASHVLCHTHAAAPLMAC